ncbi:hypothetical protein ParKJ_40895 [Paraburkholderia fungorum]|uniref:Fis family transcriptional regulator n=1 Tax=Paraburkholderia fungorum TaxID=134537 RepID=A0AAP5QIK4_9BURK|nr:hypothetical protein [Paraburkholderia fungorum]MDT8843759.1 hypothetical protein [Paraburkholderia fungorum]
MTRNIHYSRRPHVTHARRGKTLLLPMPRAAADELSLQIHLALDAMRRGKGNVSTAQTLCQAMILVGLLADLGYGAVTVEQMRSAETVISEAFDRGRDSGVWCLDEAGFLQFALIATVYDEQLRRAPMSAMAEASNRLDRFRQGEAFEAPASPPHQ